MAKASALISICTNLHSVRVDGTGHVSQFQTSRCRIRSTPKTKTIFHHIHFERDKSFMRSSVHYLRQSVKPRSDRWLSKSGNVRTCTGLRPQIDSHEASKGLLMNHEVNSNGLSYSPPCFCVPHEASYQIYQVQIQVSETDWNRVYRNLGYNRN